MVPGSLKLGTSQELVQNNSPSSPWRALSSRPAALRCEVNNRNKRTGKKGSARFVLSASSVDCLPRKVLSRGSELKASPLCEHRRKNPFRAHTKGVDERRGGEAAQHRSCVAPLCSILVFCGFEVLQHPFT